MSKINLLETRDFYLNRKEAKMGDEQTVSLLLRGRNGLTELTHSGKNYAECIGHALQLQNLLNPGERVLMVGDGLGYNSESLHMCVPDVEFIGLELSPRLIEAQQRRNPWQTIISGNVMKLSHLVRPEEFSGILLNEVVADLPVLEIDRFVFEHLMTIKQSNPSLLDDPQYIQDFIKTFGLRNNRRLLKEFLTLISKYQYPYPKKIEGKNIYINSGVVHLLEQAAKVLPKNGYMWISEYGFTDQAEVSGPAWFSSSAEKKGHQEYSIDFGYIASVAQTLGFEVFLEPLAQTVGVKTDEFACTAFLVNGVEILGRYDEDQPIWLSLKEAFEKHNPIFINREVMLAIEEDSQSYKVYPEIAARFQKWGGRMQGLFPDMNLLQLPDHQPERADYVGLSFVDLDHFFKNFYSFLAIKK
ncbi:hypothetical protein HY041_04035 [Candidatus Roizmanbacteria bacterium]|nr:hypothetical protein [Candidatus Roizmanbacteria bacterium]